MFESSLQLIKTINGQKIQKSNILTSGINY